MNVYVISGGCGGTSVLGLNVNRNAGGWQGCVDLLGSCLHRKIKDFLHGEAEKALFFTYIIDIIDK